MVPSWRVRDAADAALRDIVHRNGGRLPLTLGEAKLLPGEYGLDLVDDGGKRGMLRVREDGSGCVLYNAKAAPTDQKAAILHEVVEWITREKHMVLTDLMLPAEYYQDGGQFPRDFRHQVSAWAEKVYRKWLEDKF